MDNIQKTESIIKVINHIDNNDLVLPEFQRDFVWDIGRTYDLFDSIVRGIFIGSIIYGIPEFGLTVRELDMYPRNMKANDKKIKKTKISIEEIHKQIHSGEFRIILDGQQRITSLYRALKDIDEVWMIVKNFDELPEDFDHTNQHKWSLEEILYEFTDSEDEDRLSIKLKTVFDTIRDFGQVFDEDFNTANFYELEFIEKLPDEQKEKYLKYFHNIISAFSTLLKNNSVLSYYLMSTSEEKFALFFERSNSQAMHLNFIDILSAKLYSGFNLRERIEAFEEKHPGMYLDREVIIRAITYYIDGARDLNKSTIILKLESEHLEKMWDEMLEAYIAAYEFLLANHMIINHEFLPYKNMLIPLMIFWKEIGGSFTKCNGKQKDFIEFWYWGTIFSQRYTTSNYSTLLYDAKLLEKVAKNENINERGFFFKMKCLITTNDELIAITKKGSVMYDGVLNIINFTSKGLPDWKSGAKIGRNDELHDHHIFPKKYLEEMKEEKDFNEPSDSVVNRTLISQHINTVIGCKKPSEYLELLGKENSNLQTTLNHHKLGVALINGSYDKSYRKFLLDRASKILKIIYNTLEIQRPSLMNNWFSSPININLKKPLRVIGNYYNVDHEAFANFNEGTIQLNGEIYYDFNQAEVALKQKVRNVVIHKPNGWKFWRYIDENKLRQPVKNLKELWKKKS